MDNNYTLGTMRVFISVVENGSFSECSRLLGISQPSVSRQISNLEKNIGVQLLQRTTRSLNLTEAGQIYYVKVKKIHQDIMELDKDLSHHTNTPSGALRISVPHTWAENILMPILSQFLLQHPEITLNIECNDNYQDVILDDFDLVIRIGRLKDSTFIAVPLVKINMVLCASNKYIKKFGKPENPSDISLHNFISYDNHRSIIVKSTNQDSVIKTNGNMNANIVSLLLSAVKQGLGISVLPDILIKDLLNQGKFIHIMPKYSFEIKNLAVEQMYILCTSRKQLPAKARSLIDFIKDHFK